MDYVKRHRKQQILRRKFESKELIDSLKSKPCQNCGVCYHPCQMDFHRVDKSSPLISRILNKSQMTILEEIKKCVLLCANCARMKTFKEQRIKRADKFSKV